MFRTTEGHDTPTEGLSRERTATDWREVRAVDRAAVIDHLRREAGRRIEEADRLQEAARRLGRPSLVETSELGAEAFLAAIAVLETED